MQGIHISIKPGHASFPLSQDDLAASPSSSGNALSYHLPSQAETKALNLHHRHRLPSLDHLIPTLYYYKKIILTLITLLTTQSCLYFTSSLASALPHRSSTHRHRSLSPLSHAHHSSIQWHLQWQTSRSSFALRTVYRHVNLHKKIFWNAVASCRVIN
jgi:hypothetical protein